MVESPKYFNSCEAANILGVNVSSIKRWTEEGKLECIKTAGGHRKFTTAHLAKFIEENEQKSSRAHLFPVENEQDLELSYYITRGNFGYLRDYVTENSLDCNREQVHKALH